MSRTSIYEWDMLVSVNGEEMLLSEFVKEGETFPCAVCGEGLYREHVLDHYVTYHDWKVLIGSQKMNYKFTKKPVTIEAFQMTEERSKDNSDWPEWLRAAWNKSPREGAVWFDRKSFDRKLVIGTLEGELKVNWDDWIIQGVQGELYPCKPDIFRSTYTSAQQKLEPYTESHCNFED